MARPPKKGLDYFPLDTDLASDCKIQNLIRKGEMDAWTVYSWTLVTIYHDNYYCRIEELISQISWMFRTMTEARIVDCLEIMADCGLIDRSLYEAGIITSKGIQKRYMEVQKTRRADPDSDYWLLKPQESGVMHGQNPAEKSFEGSKPQESGVMGLDNPQTKTDKNRKNKIKRNQSKSEETVADQSDGFQPSLSDELIDLLKEAGVDVKRNTLQKLQEWIDLYDPRSIEEAVRVSISKKGTGQVKSVVGYADKVLTGWATGSGSPQWIDEEENALQAQKEEHMKPGAVTAAVLKRMGGKT